MRFPATAPIFLTPSASLRDRVSKTQFAWGSTKAACQFSWGRGRQAMHLPCKQGYAGALPADSTNFNCGENEIQASFIRSAFVGATPTPATTYIREVIQLPVCKTGVFKQAGSDDWSITSTSHHFGLVAQLAEQPVVCGKAEGASPFESAIFYRSVAQSSERLAWAQEVAGGNPAVPTISNCCRGQIHQASAF